MPPLPAAGTWETTYLVPTDSLPPETPRLPDDAGPVCPQTEAWRGSVEVAWSESGVPGGSTSRRGYALVPVAPGDGASHVLLTIDGPDPAGTTWSFEEPCPAWSAELLTDAGGAPGSPAPNPIPPGPFTGWVAVSADSTGLAS